MPSLLSEICIIEKGERKLHQILCFFSAFM